MGGCYLVYSGINSVDLYNFCLNSLIVCCLCLFRLLLLLCIVLLTLIAVLVVYGSVCFAGLGCLVGLLVICWSICYL